MLSVKQIALTGGVGMGLLWAMLVLNWSVLEGKLQFLKPDLVSLPLQVITIIMLQLSLLLFLSTTTTMIPES